MMYPYFLIFRYILYGGFLIMHDDFHIIVIPLNDDTSNLFFDERSLQLLKFALIYADKVQFVHIIPTYFALFRTLLAQKVLKEEKVQDFFKFFKYDMIGLIYQTIETKKRDKEFRKLIQKFIKFSDEKDIEIEDLRWGVCNEHFEYYREFYLDILDNIEELIGFNKFKPLVKNG